MTEDLIPKLWRVEPIARLCVPVDSTDPRQRFGDGSFRYVDISSIDNDAKSITEARTIDVVDAPSRARQVIATGDVLVSTVRPGLNAVAIVPGDLDGQICSTGFCVLRSHPDLLDSDYLFGWVRSPQFVERLVRMERGIGYPAVSDSDVKSVLIALPPISEQRRIVDILRQADELRRLRRVASRRIKDLLPSLFFEMFGDPAKNPKGWPMVKLPKLGELDRGRSRHRPRDAPHLYGGIYPFIQTGDVANSEGWITSYSQTYSEAGLAQSRLWPTGTLCITIAANIAQTGTLAFEACFPDSVVGFIPGLEATAEYVQYWLQTIQQRLEANAPQLAQKNINLGILRDLEIPKPPVELQKHFSQVVQQIRIQKTLSDRSERRTQELFQAFLTRAFTGELTAVWREAYAARLTQEAIERDQRLIARPKRLLTREDILRTPDSRDLLDAETTLAKALDGVAQQMSGSTKLVSSTLQTLAHSPVMAMVQQIQRQYAEIFDSLTLRAIRQIADDQQRILAAMAEPLRQMTEVTQRVVEDLQPIRLLLAQFAETARLALAEPDPSHPCYHLLRSLSRKQYYLYLALQAAEGYLRPEAIAEESGLPLDTVQHDLELLVTIGLAQRVNVATKPSDKLVYVPAYRRVRPSDDARLAMMERLTPQESAS